MYFLVVSTAALLCGQHCGKECHEVWALCSFSRDKWGDGALPQSYPTVGEPRQPGSYSLYFAMVIVSHGEKERQRTCQTAGLWISRAQEFKYFFGGEKPEERLRIFGAFQGTKRNHSYTAMSLSSLVWDLGIWEDIWNLFMPFGFCNSILNSYNETQ